MIEVSPTVGGTIGPTKTFGYPYLPTKTPGGDDPWRSDLSKTSFILMNPPTLIRTGQDGLPHRNLVPLHRRHIDDVPVLVRLGFVPRPSLLEGVIERP
jgi:hypothetical protein